MIKIDYMFSNFATIDYCNETHPFIHLKEQEKDIESSQIFFLNYGITLCELLTTFLPIFTNSET